jgi:glycine amidinotransferase
VFDADSWVVTKWVFTNILSLDEERFLMHKGEENLKKFFIQLGMKPIEVDISHCHHLGGAFHCWSLDIKRKGTLQDYFS